MSRPTPAIDLGTLAPPEINRRARRRNGFVLLLLALLCLAFTGLCVAFVYSDEVQHAGEGLLALGILFVGGTALLFAIGLLVGGLVALLRRRLVRQAAWLEDPADRSVARRWDGRAWTRHTTPRDPAVVALAPLTSNSRRRHRQGLALLVGGVVVAVGGVVVAEVLLDPSNSTIRLRAPDGGFDLGPLVSFAALVAVVGLYLLLTFDDDPVAGWHPDPLDPARIRWWDGRSWTNHTERASAA